MRAVFTADTWFRFTFCQTLWIINYNVHILEAGVNKPTNHHPMCLQCFDTVGWQSETADGM